LATTLSKTNELVGKYSRCVMPVILTSSKSKSGVAEIQRIISGMVERKKLSKLKDISDKAILEEN
jgi:hypothetical protein